MWHVYATDHETAPQDNGPLKEIGVHDNMQDALSTIAKTDNDDGAYYRYVLVFKEGE